jgi:hypothetical protein
MRTDLKSAGRRFNNSMAAKAISGLKFELDGAMTVWASFNTSSNYLHASMAEVIALERPRDTFIEQ